MGTAAPVISGPVDIDLAAGPFAVSVLRRVVGAVCAQAGLGIDRLTDAAILAETLAAEAPRHAADGRLRLRVAPGSGVVEIEVGPLANGGAETLTESSRLPGVGAVLERLADGYVVRATAEGDFVHMSLRPAGLPKQGAGY